MENNLVLKRNEVPSELTWDISTVYENVETFENAFKEIEEMLPTAQNYQSKLASSADFLLEALTFRNEVLKKIEHLYTYSHLLSDQDTSNTDNQALQSRARSLYSKVASALSFYETELLEADETVLKEYLEKENQSEYLRSTAKHPPFGGCLCVMVLVLELLM